MISELCPLGRNCPPPPPLCQAVVATHMRQAFDLMPPPAELLVHFRPDYDHYLDDILVVMEDKREWLRSYMRLVLAAMHAKCYRVSDKSVLEPTTWVKWLGKEVDLEAPTISHNISIVTRLFACFVVL